MELLELFLRLRGNGWSDLFEEVHNHWHSVGCPQARPTTCVTAVTIMSQKYNEVKNWYLCGRFSEM